MHRKAVQNVRSTFELSSSSLALTIKNLEALCESFVIIATVHVYSNLTLNTKICTSDLLNQ